MLDAFPRTQAIVGLALGHPVEIAERLPSLSFEPGDGLRALDARAVAAEDQHAIAAQMIDAYCWCARRFPLGIRTIDGARVSAVAAICLGRSGHAGEFLTASSPQRPGTIFVAAPWPLSSRYRLASLVAHEAMHQALYDRERAGPVARLGSLGYSPWKEQLRPGRLVWHAFWTFSAQFVFLAEAIASPAEAVLAADLEMPEFLGEMDARLECCVESLASFEIVAGAEHERVDAGSAIVSAMRSWLGANVADYGAIRARWQAMVDHERDTWASRQRAAHDETVLSLA
jgi:hypothetical protein